MKLTGDTKTRIYFHIGHDKLHNLITGDWFNAYAYSVMEEHLTMNYANFELFTKVDYQAPNDIHRFGSDFDLIGAIGDKIIFVESKSGKMGDLDNKSIVQRVKQIQEIFTKVNGTQSNITPFLIYNSKLTENKEVKTSIKNNINKTSAPNIVVVDPSEIRRSLVELMKAA